MMEYAEGGSLWDMLSRTDDIPFARRMEVALDAARGLHYLHTNQPAVLHRDIKGCAPAHTVLSSESHCSALSVTCGKCCLSRICAASYGPLHNQAVADFAGISAGHSVA